jgi:hypothetical protein
VTSFNCAAAVVEAVSARLPFRGTSEAEHEQLFRQDVATSDQARRFSVMTASMSHAYAERESRPMKPSHARKHSRAGPRPIGILGQE